jgi:2-iminoacetate synthase
VSFLEQLRLVPLEELLELTRDADDWAVEQALAVESPDLHDFAALLSPAADARLEEIAERAHRLTVQRFGRTVQLYAPLYVSNECLESCTYCSFARKNPVERRTLTVAEAVAEAGLLTEQGFRHLLIVAGEHPRLVSADYLAQILAALQPQVPSLSLEVQPQRTHVYERWVAAGAEGLVVYQETYDRDVYAAVHPAGKKRNYDWRLATAERAGEAGMKRLGIGALLGLADWRLEAVHLAAHARYLIRRYWKAFVTVSLPRLRPAAFAIDPPHPVADRDFAKLVCAIRLLLPDVGIVLSTRESPGFRDGVLPLGVTQMSAGSRTEPGGYSHPDETEKQFAVEDLRSPAEVSRAIRDRGYDPVWKDWEGVLNG